MEWIKINKCLPPQDEKIKIKATHKNEDIEITCKFKILKIDLDTNAYTLIFSNADFEKYGHLSPTHWKPL